MPDLFSCLSNHDLSFLRDIAEAWDLNPTGRDKNAYLRSLVEELKSPTLLEDFFETLPAEANIALQTLKQLGGQMAWSAFIRSFGEVRSMGPARRARLEPMRFPISTSEWLWYRGLIGRDFLRSENGLAEMAYVPEELLAKISEGNNEEKQHDLSSLFILEDEDIKVVEKSSDQMLDHICTLLGALRSSQPGLLLAKTKQSTNYWKILLSLLKSFHIVSSDNLPASAAKLLLEMPRAKAFAWLLEHWQSSRGFNELRLIPNLNCQGTWQNDAYKPRHTILDCLKALPSQRWINLESFIALIQKDSPDFLREGGDYHSWIITTAEPEKKLLTGVSSWPFVEGAYLRFLINHLMVWFGIIEIGTDQKDRQAILIRKTAWFEGLHSPNLLEGFEEETAPVVLNVNGRLEMTNLTPRVARYQLSRFADWKVIGPKRYQYELTPASLRQAESQGLEARHLLSLLRKYAAPPPTPAFQKTITRWEEKGREAWVEKTIVLRLASPEILQALHETNASSYLGEALSPVAIVVKPGGIEKVRHALARLGYLSDLNIEVEQ